MARHLHVLLRRASGMRSRLSRSCGAFPRHSSPSRWCRCAAGSAVSYPAVFGNIVLSQRSRSPHRARRERQRAARHRQRSRADGRTGAWLLGLNLGRDAVFRQYAPSNRELPDQLMQGRERPGGASLRLRRPTFRRAVRQRQHRIRRIRRAGRRKRRTSSPARSPQACELFKLGALWGYSEMVRPSSLGNARSSRWKSVITRGGRTCRSRSGARCWNSLQPTPSARTSSQQQKR